MNTVRKAASAAIGLAMVLATGVAVAGEYISFGTFSGVEIAWRNHDQSDGSGGRYYEQLLRISNSNPYAVDVSYSVVLVCADGSSGSTSWEGLDTLGPGKTHSGELAGLWTRSCSDHGEAGRARSARLTVKVTQQH